MDTLIPCTPLAVLPCGLTGFLVSVDTLNLIDWPLAVAINTSSPSLTFKQVWSASPSLSHEGSR